MSEKPATALTVFVGSISPGIQDRWITQLLDACGGLLSFKRVSKAFGFAELESAPDVLRARAVLHDVPLPSMGAEHALPAKRLVVKADEKTDQFLAQFEHTLVHTDLDRQREREARQRVEKLLAAMRQRAADGETDRNLYEIPAHLKDLPAEELRGQKRMRVLSEIEKFRLSALARDAAERKRDLEMERRRAATAQPRARPPPETAASTPEPFEADPEEADEAAEQRRKQAVAERRAREERNAEYAYADREQTRIAFWANHTPAPVPAKPLWEPREDDELHTALFWTDRRRWLAERAPHRRREQEADAGDRELHAAEQEQARRDADAFLEEQAREMAAMADKARLSGLLVHKDGAPLKLHVHRSTDPGTKARLAFVDALQGTSRAQVEAALPHDTAALWAIAPDWRRVDPAAYRALIDAGIEESVGEAVDDLREALLDRVRAEAPASELCDVLAPVLDEDAAPLVTALWRALLVDSISV